MHWHHWRHRHCMPPCSCKQKQSENAEIWQFLCQCLLWTVFVDFHTQQLASTSKFTTLHCCNKYTCTSNMSAVTVVNRIPWLSPHVYIYRLTRAKKVDEPNSTRCPWLLLFFCGRPVHPVHGRARIAGDKVLLRWRMLVHAIRPAITERRRDSR